MDNYSFLNAAHSAYFAELYEQYLQQPDSVEPSWRAFFQGFDFGMESNGTVQTETVEVPEHLQNEFKVVKLIDGYRSRGHLLPKPIRLGSEENTAQHSTLRILVCPNKI
jgi:2-oxoglutarate dehydrogenase E1 component